MHQPRFSSFQEVTLIVVARRLLVAVTGHLVVVVEGAQPVAQAVVVRAAALPAAVERAQAVVVQAVGVDW